MDTISGKRKWIRRKILLGASVLERVYRRTIRRISENKPGKIPIFKIHALSCERDFKVRKRAVFFGEGDFGGVVPGRKRGKRILFVVLKGKRHAVVAREGGWRTMERKVLCIAWGDPSLSGISSLEELDLRLSAEGYRDGGL